MSTPTPTLAMSDAEFEEFLKGLGAESLADVPDWLLPEGAPASDVIVVPETASAVDKSKNSWLNGFSSW